MKKVVVWLMVAMMAVSVCGCGSSDGVKDGMEAAANKETETEGATEEQTRPKLRNLRAFRKQKLNRRRKHRE